MSSVARVGGNLDAEIGVATEPWRTRIDTLHSIAASFVLLSLSSLAAVSPASRDLLDGSAGGALLVGGALIGLPHGSSDFVVAHRVLRPRLGRGWLTTFLLGYLALVAVILSAWSAAPLVTLIGFLAISALHFGSGEARPREGATMSGLRFAVWTAMPLLPIFLLHPTEVAPLLGMLGDVAESSVLQILGKLRSALLFPWIAALSIVVVHDLTSSRRTTFESAYARQAIEVFAIAAAAAVLPPLLAFGLYFCLVHAVRHLIGLAHEQHPRNGRAAANLVVGVTLPSALLCLTALTVTWNGLAGLLDTQATIAVGLKVIAALTVPHILLDAFAAHRSRL